MTEEQAILAFIAFAFGTTVGSFLNVVIHRVPRGESVVSPPSHCTSCGEYVRWFDNLPIVSWLWLRGKCRFCGATFSARYLFIELLTGLIAAGLVVRLDLGIELAAAFYFTCVLLAIAYIDLDHQIIPDRLSLPGIVVGLICAPLINSEAPLAALMDSAIGVLVGGGILYAVAEGYARFAGREGMGGGDIKLLAMIGAFLGWQGVLLTLLLASLIGSVIGVSIMLARGSDTKLAIPFGPFLSIGAFVALFWGAAIVSWYLAAAGLSV